MITYEDYLLSKQISASPQGFDIDLSDINPTLFDWQARGLQWLLKIGKGLAGWKMGLGKTFLQIEWARLVHEHTKAPVLIVAPLAVGKQTIREAQKLGVEIEFIRSMEEARLADTPITIVNFDMFRRKFESWYWRDGGLIIDESSILASYQGETKKFIIPFMSGVKYALCCSGTPARNDYMELGNHSEALGVMPSNEMLTNWFMPGGGKVFSGEIIAGKYRLKKMGEEDFWRWVTTWALIVNVPSDIGGCDEGYILPEIEVKSHTLSVNHSRAWDMVTKKGQRHLFLPDSPSSTQMWADKQATYKDRVYKALEIAKGCNDYMIFWADLNDEATLLYNELNRLYPGEVVEVSGSDNLEDKEAKLDSFSRGDSRIIVTKDKIAGMGLNWQHCNRQVFVSINYKWESFVQRLARTNRFGNKRKTIIDLIASETEQGILKALKRKGLQDEGMHKWVKRIYDKYGLWRFDKKVVNTDLGDVEMELPAWLK
jgi:hypothetical protein